jgi:hypothetical protein
MTEEANPTQGADLTAAADRIGSLISPPAEKAPEAPQAEAKASQPQEGEQIQQEQQEAQGQAQEAAPQESETPDFSTIQELAEAIGVPVDEFLGKIKGRVKINGVEQEVTLADMRNGYQMESDYRRKTAELAEQRKAFESERESVAQGIQRQFNEAQALTSVLEQQLTAEFQNLDWANLRVSDPAEFAAKRQEYNERFAHIQAIKANVENNLQQQAAYAQQQQQEQVKEILRQESERLAEALPEFRDPAKAKAVRGELRNFLQTMGYTDTEIATVFDHRQVMIIRDAMEYRKLKEKGVEVKNKVATAPKLSKPGSQESKAGNEAFRDKLAKLRKSGRVEDAAELIKL